MPNTGPTVVRRQLGRRLRVLRNQAKKTERDVEIAKVASRTKLWRIETGKAAVSIGDARALCWFYGADAKTTEVMTNMALGTQEQNWWESNEFAVPGWLGLFVGLESLATEIRLYESELVHGLFQTSDYARIVHEVCQPADIDPTIIDRTVHARLRRQETLFSRTRPPQITAIFNESVLARKVGGEAAMAKQVVRIRELAARSHVEVRILPWSAGAHAAMIGSFSIFDFGEVDDPPTAYVECQTGARYIDKVSEVVEHRRIFDLALEQTIPLEEYLS